MLKEGFPPRVMERAGHLTRGTDEINSSLLVSILTAQGKRTPHTTHGHVGVALHDKQGTE